MILHTEFGWIWTTPWTDEKSPSDQSLVKLQQKFFLSYTLLRQWILYTALASFWTHFSPNEENLFKKITYSNLFGNNSKFSFENLTFSWASYRKNIFCPTLRIHRGYSIPNLVGVGQLYDSIKFPIIQS